MTLARKLLFIFTALLLVAPPSFAKKKRAKRKPVKPAQVKLLSFDQLAEMEFWQRVEYIKLVRKSLVDIEKFQKVYGMKYMTSQNLRDRNSLWALIFGDSASARDAQLVERTPYQKWLDAKLRAENLKPGESLGEADREILRNPPKSYIQTFATDQVGRMEELQTLYEAPASAATAAPIAPAQAVEQVNQVQPKARKTPPAKQRQFRILEKPPIPKALEAEPSGTHTRGANPSDRCIYAGNLNPYVSNRNPFGCSKPPRCKPKSGGTGVECGFVLSGLTGDAACIPMHSKLDSTSLCMARAKRERGNQKGVREPIVRKIRAYIEGKEKWPNKKGPLDPQHVKELEKHAYDPVAMALLIELYGYYKDAGKKFPIASFRKEWDDTLSGAQAIFSDYIEHCERPMSDQAIKGIEQYKLVQNKYNRNQDKKRFELLTKFRTKNPGKRPAVKDILQPMQCQLVEKRRDEAVAQIDRLEPKKWQPLIPQPPGDGGGQGEDKVATLKPKVVPAPQAPPVIIKPEPPRQDKEEKEVVRKPPPEKKKPRKVIPAPPKKRVPGYAPQDKRYACFRQDFQNAVTKSKPMNCVACAEHSRVQDDPDNITSQKISDKWSTLLTIMGQQCGNYRSPTNMNVQDALNLMQTYGSCSQGVYDWSGKNLGSQRATIDQWQSGNLKDADCTLCGGKPNFKDVFGASLSTLKSAFCGGPPSGRRAKLYNKVKRSGRSFNDDLENCIHQAVERAEKYYAKSGPNKCSKMVPYNKAKADDTLPKLFEGELAIIEVNEGDGYNCLVSTGTRISHNVHDHAKTDVLASFESMSNYRNTHFEQTYETFYDIDERHRKRMRISTVHSSRKNLCADSAFGSSGQPASHHDSGGQRDGYQNYRDVMGEQ